ncbi:septum site-determining protein MinC [uncultured Thiodictyon sp.]|jgi:septum site-determining protein MinC|uniref:septum site-determining protein MinC n=1 Tax=uncultured Thiodictyon sp. TaxID=1846217 RepID=UPI0025D28228|nr:septum site-determining protein MinC [uncultured Thiodictyon sp.]
MAVNSRPPAGEAPPAFELKAAGFTLPVIRLLNGDMEAVAEQIGAKVEQAPDFFHNTPVVIDLGAFPEWAGEVEFPLLVGLLRGYGMIPFGVRGGSKSQHAAAEAMDLAVLGEAYSRSAKAAPAAPTAAAPEAGRGAVPTFTLVTRPVRSGQSIYAAGGDLSVIAPVSSGAELQADGNIHVYGVLRGRAQAGHRGNVEARIFCQDLQAELVSVAGHYRVAENIPADLRGVPVQVYLDQKILRIEKI